MKTLHRFIFKSYLPPFAMTFVISVFILFMQFLWKWVDELVGKGLDWKVVTELFSFAALSTVPLALPLSVLLSSLMTFGNLAEHYELAAMKSAGLSLTRILRPLIFTTLLTTAGAFLFSNYLLPYTNLKMLSTLFDIRQKKPDLNIKEGVFYNEIDGFSLRIKKREGALLKGIMIYDHTNHMGNTSLTVAESGKMTVTDDKRTMVVELENGETYKDVTDAERAQITKPFMRMKFHHEVMRLDLSGFQLQRTQEDLFKENHQMLNGEQLLAYIDTMREEMVTDRQTFYSSLRDAYLTRSKPYWNTIDTMKTPLHKGNFMAVLTPEERSRVYDLALNSARNCKSAAESKQNELDAEEKSILRFKIEFWKKYTYSVACLIMFFVGAPLGAIIRKGGLGMPVVISVFAFIIFWVLSVIGEKLSKEGSVPPELGMWLACAAFLPVGIWLTRKASADSAMFDRESMMSRLSKLLFWKKKKPIVTVPEETKENDPPENPPGDQPDSIG